MRTTLQVVGDGEELPVGLGPELVACMLTDPLLSFPEAFSLRYEHLGASLVSRLSVCIFASRQIYSWKVWRRGYLEAYSGQYNG